MRIKGKTTAQLQKMLKRARAPKRGYIIHLLRGRDASLPFSFGRPDRSKQESRFTDGMDCRDATSTGLCLTTKSEGT